MPLDVYSSLVYETIRQYYKCMIVLYLRERSGPKPSYLHMLETKAILLLKSDPSNEGFTLLWSCNTHSDNVLADIPARKIPVWVGFSSASQKVHFIKKVLLKPVFTKARFKPLVVYSTSQNFSVNIKQFKQLKKRLFNINSLFHKYCLDLDYVFITNISYIIYYNHNFYNKLI